MSAYLIAEGGEITDQALYAEFMSKIAGLMESQGGKYIARSSAVQVVSGSWSPQRVIIIEFESLEQAQAAVSSPEYLELAEIRDKSSTTSTVLVEGRVFGS